MLQKGEVSRLHRIKSDEVWCIHAGRLDVHAIDDAGHLRTYKLGTVDERLPQATVPANWWFGAELPSDETYALVNCIVAPASTSPTSPSPTNPPSPPSPKNAHEALP